MNRRDSILAASVAVVWGVNFVVMDWGVGARGGGVPPLLFAALRFTLVAVPAVFFVPRPQARWSTVIAVGAFISLGQFGLLYSALAAGMPAGLAGLVLQAQIPLTIVFAAGVLRERPTLAQTCGVTAGVAGLAIVGPDRGGEVPWLALGLCSLAGVSLAIGNVISRAARVTNGSPSPSGLPWSCPRRWSHSAS